MMIKLLIFYKISFITFLLTGPNYRLVHLFCGTFFYRKHPTSGLVSEYLV